MALSPPIKFETSPTESLLSDPSGVFPSLFSAAASTIASSGAATPVDTGVFGDFGEFGDGLNGAKMQMSAMDLSRLDDLYTARLTGEEIQTTAHQAEAPKTAAPEKEEKKTKKRKSWGQVLPEPKTNLPPRKRAKTEDEKEQRRVERVLRNRRAAQSSRERKRLEVDALERRNRELEAMLAKAQSDNLVLYTQLCHLQGKPAVLPAVGAAAPVTLSRELFGSSAILTPSSSPSVMATIDPLSLSPPLRPVPDANANNANSLTIPSTSTPPSSLPQSQAPARPAAEATDGVPAAAASLVVPSPDMTQRPAATLCSDLQCLASGRGDAVVPGDFVAVPFLDGVFDMAAATAAVGDDDDNNDHGGSSHFEEASQQPSEYSSCFLVDGDDDDHGALPPLFASVVGPSSNDFDIGDFLNADGLASASPDTNDTMSRTGSRRGAGECGSDRPCMLEEEALTGADLQPHTGASLVGCDDAGSAVCV